MRKSFKITGIGCGLLVLLVAGFLGYAIWTLRPQPPTSALPPLVRDLPHEAVRIEPAFQQRVRDRFPEGMSSDALAARLGHDGFFLRNDRKSGLAFASLDQKGFPCVSGWTIAWRPDRQGRAHNISGHFNLGCL